MKVYHIVKNELEFAVGDIILPRIYDLNSFAPKKKEIEMELEIIRNKGYSNYPSRLNCLFVCHDMNDVEFWAMMKSNIYGSQLIVLTLDTIGPVFWFSAEGYNMYFNGQRNDLRQACLEFWESNKNTEFDKLIDREGITNGPAKIIEIRQASFSRGKGFELNNK